MRPPDTPGLHPSGTMTPLTGNGKRTRTLIGTKEQRAERFVLQQREHIKSGKTKRPSEGEGARNPSYKRGERKPNRRLNPHVHHDGHVRRVTSPRPIMKHMHTMPGPGRSGDAPGK
jgi:hypothetical protein